MTVAELISELSKMPQDAQVFVPVEGGVHEFTPPDVELRHDAYGPYGVYLT